MIRCLPDNLIEHRIDLLRRESVQIESEIWRCREELRRRHVEEGAKLSAYLDERHPKSVTPVDVGPIV